MNQYELLNIIGEVSEDYALAADSDAAQPRFRWQTLAACAACAALILAAYPAWQGLSPKPTSDSAQDVPEALSASDDELIQRPGLHAYTLVEGGVTVITTGGSTKAPSDGQPDPMPEQGGGSNAPATAVPGSEGDPTVDSAESDAATQEEAHAQSERLFRSLNLREADGTWGRFPDWCGGVWLEGEHLVVAIVDGFRTPGLEAQIRDWCGGTAEILLPGVKYSIAYLEDLKDQVAAVLDQYGGIPSVIDAQETANRVKLKLFEMPSDEVLAALDELDPEGDAIYILVFAGAQIIPTVGSAKEPAADPVEPH